MWPTETCSQMFLVMAYIIHHSEFWSGASRKVMNPWTELVYSKANVYSFCSPETVPYRWLVTVFPWLGRSIGSPWWGSYSIKWNRTGIWWDPGEKAHVHISDFTFLKIPQGCFEDISFHFAMGFATLPMTTPSSLRKWHMTCSCLSPTICTQMLTGPEQNPEKCHALHTIV